MRVIIQDLFREARASHLKEQRQALEAERRSASQRLQVKQEEAEILKDELAVALNSLRDADTVVWRACTQISRLRERFRERNFVQAMFIHWLGQIRWEKRETLLVAKASRWCGARFLAHLLFLVLGHALVKLQLIGLCRTSITLHA
jgi:hypothetical protein